MSNALRKIIRGKISATSRALCSSAVTVVSSVAGMIVVAAILLHGRGAPRITQQLEGTWSGTLSWNHPFP